MAALFSMFCMAAQAGTITIVVSQDGSDVIFTGSGSLDTAGYPSPMVPGGLTSVFSRGTSQSLIRSYQGGPSGPGVVTKRELPSGGFTFLPLSSTETFTFDVTSGDDFGFQFVQGGRQGPIFRPSRGILTLTSGHKSGDSVNFVWRVLNNSVDGLDLNFGTIGTFGTNAIVLTQVPLPAAVWLFISALGGLLSCKYSRPHNPPE
ncbi:MAG: hypothetical protein AAF541_11450 [Pseudomonadota bacterium]